MKPISLILSFFALFNALTGCAQKSNKTGDKMEMEVIKAAKGNDTEKLQVLLNKRVTIDARDSDQRTALMVATYENNVEAAKMLIEAGADVNAQDNRLESPLLHAGALGYPEILKTCLATGEADHMVLNRYGGTALIPACERGHTDVVKELLKIDDYPIDHVNNLGWTALMEAIVLGNGAQTHTHIVQLLVDAGCNVNIPDGNGISPLQHAKERGFNDIVAILEKAGAE
ncbi:ankyrin repeat domain-containing protein [Pricia sp. S334]|uniref:Ankyrin repeat domain-containing protein n=1 Tax=Pricia mediterranea TaxID=3076079 RepID=A0ABU3L124_9FLAO|nr:ankyrin repeat domain-containing protein [Pricia sp. S334]MDT7827132.1 ankyrin repeat domain-containing protein [Pricia sp. S334]